MNIIIDVNHPGHVHLFKNFAFIGKEKGWKILFTAKDKEVTVDLLKAYGFDYKVLGAHYTSKAGKIYSLFKHVFRLIFVSLKFRPHYYLSHGSVPASWASFVLRKKYIAFEDTGNMEQIKLYKPFAHAILTTLAFKRDFGKVHVRYNGYHEIAYLHPNYFNPNPEILEYLGVSENEKYFVLRFISWGATHDTDKEGLSLDDKREIVKFLQSRGKVFISSEGKLPEDLKYLGIKIPPDKIHDALSYAYLYLGEGLTMASECAMLGTPAVHVNTMTAETIEEQEKYGLLFHFSNMKGVNEKIEELLKFENIKEIWQQRRHKLINDKMDVTAFTVWFVQNFPESLHQKWPEN